MINLFHENWMLKFKFEVIYFVESHLRGLFSGQIKGQYHNKIPLIFTFQPLDPKRLCAEVSCRPGRECRVLSSGTPECVCARQCHRRRHPVCGSDGIIYENHCALHREACIRGLDD